MAIEQAFGLLKARWRILMKRQDAEFHHLYCCITACFILHNICINNGNDHLPIWNEDVNFNLFNDVDCEPDIIMNDNEMRNYITIHYE